ncbi:Similarity [Microcystis aeruginosa PCC 9432]|jgi:hypothetical protein|uniref:DUF4277 domain-containing protein n=9 Tax=Microcystis TaxID=1125 RepID=A0A2H6BYC4_MICAE|nr:MULTISPECIES: DUF4277 domain-containing protein [Microcystis]NCR99406.1 DUF4277 domain-containing protein [Microcystis aeruginosa L311-01]REJ39040.1 MAG: DUF4277 domain-containing protein [Microcystis flos-aquae TF09]TRT93248.1 MAG: DUF4277 domain-containing protein [Microcystis aeruginosa Ma_OC_LR_19540900_S633]TRT97691.1 MAG: DUF4277 domain-containing protein [Microcystis aeruginosa Ma_AC_P_19900807_S300]TRU08931.1 MAG: DUF4277 domain-containing protein [Microcystis aeruginosa Ma_MB_F_200
MTQLTVKNPDHLGIIAAIIDELGIVDYMNQQLGEKDTTHSLRKSPWNFINE